MSYDLSPYGHETLHMTGSDGLQVFLVNYTAPSVATPFPVGSLVTGGVTGAVGTVRFDDTVRQTVYFSAVTAAFNNTELITGSTGKTATSIAYWNWFNQYLPGGYSDGINAVLRPAYVDSVIIETPALVGSGSTGILLQNLPGPIPLRNGPPQSGTTTATYNITGAATQGSYVVPVHAEFDLGLIVRFEQLPAGPARVAIVFQPFGGARYLHSP